MKTQLQIQLGAADWSQREIVRRNIDDCCQPARAQLIVVKFVSIRAVSLKVESFEKV